MRWLGCVAGLLLAIGCREQQPAPNADARAQATADARADTTGCGAAARRVVEQFGARLKLVSVLAPQPKVGRELRMNYGPFVTPELLAEWQADPRGAPGRETSNPWPARIQIDSMRAEAAGCRVHGDVVYVTTSDPSVAIELRPVVIHVRNGNAWRISAFESAGREVHAAVQLIRRYYTAIQRRDFDAAYHMWAGEGRASGQTAAEFAQGFAETEDVHVEVDDDVRVEGAAGSQYATVAVRITATLRDQTEQRFAGTYTVRRSVVDGATPEQRTWHIYSAQIRQL